ncbi:uncharacterized protein O3C94_023697 [Discoglossus pictus]
MECENGNQSDWSNDQHCASIAYKRKRCENGGSVNETNGNTHKAHVKQRGSFIQIFSNKGTYQSQQWKPNGTTLYSPVTSHLLVNFEKYDQISFDEGLFFIGDSSGGCLQKEQGHVMHCWRFDEKAKELFISLSFLFTNFWTFQEVFTQLNGTQ